MLLSSRGVGVRGDKMARGTKSAQRSAGSLHRLALATSITFSLLGGPALIGLAHADQPTHGAAKQPAGKQPATQPVSEPATQPTKHANNGEHEGTTDGCDEAARLHGRGDVVGDQHGKGHADEGCPTPTPTPTQPADPPPVPVLAPQPPTPTPTTAPTPTPTPTTAAPRPTARPTHRPLPLPVVTATSGSSVSPVFAPSARPVPVRPRPLGKPAAQPVPTASPAAATFGGGLLLMVTPNSVAPGGALHVTGRGCRPGEPVLLAVDQKPVLTVFAGPDGAFSSPLKVPGQPGRHTTTATCGASTVSGVFDVVLATSGGSSAPGALTAAALMLAVFLMLSGIVLPGRTI